MSYIEKEKLIKADIASIENRVRHAFNQGYDLGFKDGKEKAKPQEQEPRWIPISERLPKEYEPVILSTDEEEVFIARYLGKMDDGTDCFDDEDGMMWEGDVIAWMPLPKPYKGESEG